VFCSPIIFDPPPSSVVVPPLCFWSWEYRPGTAVCSSFPPPATRPLAHFCVRRQPFLQYASARPPLTTLFFDDADVGGLSAPSRGFIGLRFLRMSFSRSVDRPRISIPPDSLPALFPGGLWCQPDGCTRSCSSPCRPSPRLAQPSKRGTDGPIPWPILGATCGRAAR